MSTLYFVEILTPAGEVQTRYKFSALPVSIGRAYTNDIILDDPHTAAEHAVIEHSSDGNMIIRDLESQNGLQLKGIKKPAFPVAADAVFRLGQTHVRIRDSHYQVSAEIADATNHRWVGWPLFFSGLLMIVLIALLNTWMSDFSDNKITEYIVSVASWLGVCAVWVGLWALANRVFSGAAHFSRHLFTLGCAVAALELMEYLFGTLAFAFSWEIFTAYSSHVQIAILATAIYYHLRHIKPRNTQCLKIFCVSLAMIGSGLTLIRNYQNFNQYTDELYMHELLPPALRVSRNHSIAEFDASVADMKQIIDAERENSLKEKNQKAKSP